MTENRGRAGFGPCLAVLQHRHLVKRAISRVLTDEMCCRSARCGGLVASDCSTAWVLCSSPKRTPNTAIRIRGSSPMKQWKDLCIL